MAVRLVTYIRDLELVKLLQMLSEYLDELGRGYVFHSVYVSVEEVKMLLHINGHVRHSRKYLPPFLLDYAIFIK